MNVTASDVIFLFEPTYKATAMSDANLKEGDIIEIQSYEIKKNETLILQRCGEPCNTAKYIYQWQLADFERSESQKITLTEPGTYYFWIQQTTDKGEVGPVFGVHETVNDDSVFLHYQSGSKIRVRIK